MHQNTRAFLRCDISVLLRITRAFDAARRGGCARTRPRGPQTGAESRPRMIMHVEAAAAERARVRGRCPGLAVASVFRGGSGFVLYSGAQQTPSTTWCVEA